MSKESVVVLGIDVGTSGVRALAADEDGEVLAYARTDFPDAFQVGEGGRHEQDPEQWWRAVSGATGRLMAELEKCRVAPEALRALAVDGTSGTLVAMDGAGRPVRPALMYCDGRGAEQAELLNRRGSDFLRRHGYRFGASFSAAKMLWIRENEADSFGRTKTFAHQADYVTRRLTGGGVVTDFNNALKSGYDLLEDCWPEWLACELDLGERLPPVVAPGTPIGEVSAEAAEQSGLPRGLAVMAGTTDGVAACLASGLRCPGEYNTTLGTTMVFKGLGDRIPGESGGLIYSHRLPGDCWLPGAASNTGTDWIGRWFEVSDVGAMDEEAGGLILSAPMAYPLTRRGERFPFARSEATGFFVRPPESTVEAYAACLLGTALVERLCYEVLDAVTGRSRGAVYATGGGSRSEVWNQCRADVTGRVLHRPRNAESAFGAAVLAASGVLGERLERMIERMVRIEKSYFPNVGRAGLYEERFEEFGEQLRSRGYL